MDTRFTTGALRAAKAAQEHIAAANYTYRPEEAAVSIDAVLALPQLLALVEELVDDAKRDLAASPNWTGTTVRVGRGKLKELANLAAALKG